MENSTGYLPGFSRNSCLRRLPGETGRALMHPEKLDGLAAVVAKFISADVFTLAVGERYRVYTPWVTFVAFLGQVISRGSACREAVRRVQAWCLAGKQAVPDGSTSAYCQARERLKLEGLRAAHEQLGRWIEQRSKDSWQWYGRQVKVLDGCGLSMPDTDKNRARFPYAGGQKPGCGFPTAQLVGLFCLATGRLVRFAIDSWKTHEIPLARQLIGWVEKGEVVLTDRGFCGWGLIALFQRKGVDVVMRAHQARKLAGKQMRWPKPQRGSQTWTTELWAELPDAMTMRIVRFCVSIPGFRTKEVVLVTTLLDTHAYPDEAIIALYRRRWAVELCFRDIKTTLGLDVLRCQSPALIEKEVWMQVIAYNLVRALMIEAAWSHDVTLERLSFKGTVDILRQWAPLLAPSHLASKKARQELLRIIAADQVPERPNRSEPRARKRRPKPYQWLSRPRKQFKVSKSRIQK